MKMTIDRFEGDFAVVVLENGETALISKKTVPRGREGDVLRLNFDRALTKKRAEEARAAFENLLDKGGGAQ